jgi:hypothetical protein
MPTVELNNLRHAIFLSGLSAKSGITIAKLSGEWSQYRAGSSKEEAAATLRVVLVIDFGSNAMVLNRHKFDFEVGSPQCEPGHGIGSGARR